jgi:hypothetical protein
VLFQHPDVEGVFPSECVHKMVAEHLRILFSENSRYENPGTKKQNSKGFKNVFRKIGKLENNFLKYTRKV